MLIFKGKECNKTLSYLADNYLFEPTVLPIRNVTTIFNMNTINQIHKTKFLKTNWQKSPYLSVSIIVQF